MRCGLVILAVVGCGRIDFDEIGTDPTARVDLELPIEMLGGASLASTAASIDFDRTQTALDTTAYDGTVTYSFEVVAVNLDPDLEVDLVDTTDGSVVAALTVKNSGEPTRFRVPFMPAHPSAIYIVRVSAATDNYRLVVSDARIIVNQRGATKTRLYVPMWSFDQSISAYTVGANHGPADTAPTTLYGQPSPDFYTIWHFDRSQFATIAPGSPWMLDAVVGCDAPTGATNVALFDRTLDRQVAGAEIGSSSANDAAYVMTTFQDDAATMVDGNDFEVRMRAVNGAVGGYFFKAGLWLSIENLVRGEVPIRVAGEHDGAGSLDGARSLVDLSAYSNPTVAFETTSGTGGMTTLLDANTDDNGTTGTAVATIAATPTKSAQRVPVSLASAHRYFASVIDPANTGILTTATIVIGFGR